MKQKPVCELEDFSIHKLLIEWLNPPKSEKESISYGFDYDLICHSDDAHLIKIIMRFWLEQATSNEELHCPPYKLHAEIVGIFSFPEDIDDKKMAYLCRVNSMTILYGILRGEIANVTGSFPAGKYILPTVMMPDVVNEIEKRKDEERQKVLKENPE